MNNLVTIALFLFLSVVSCQSQAEKNTSNKSSETTAVENNSSEITDFIEMGTDDIVGPMTIHGKFTKRNGMNGKYVRLYETEGKDIFLIDSAKIVNGAFTFTPKEVHVGLHRFGVIPDERSLGEIILNPNEKEFTINFSSASFKKGYTVENSRENEGWIAYMKDRAIQKAVLSNIKKSKDERSVKLKRLYKSQKELKVKEDSFAKAYAGTFFGKMVRRFQSPNRWDKNKYWEDIKFDDPNLIHSRVYSNRIMDYMRNHAKKENTDKDPTLGYYNAVDIIAQKIKEGKNDRVLEFMLYTMSEGMYSSGHEDVSMYVIDNYFYGESCGDAEISELFKRKAAGIRNLQVGNEPPMFVGAGHDGKRVDLAKIVKDNKYTLVFFWASYCHKCEAEIPILKTVYDSYHSKGFEVVGVSVDLQKQAWLNAIKANSFKWRNCSEIKGWKGDVPREYRVSSTPAMFLIDSNGKLVYKGKTAKEIKNFLTKNLK